MKWKKLSYKIAEFPCKNDWRTYICVPLWTASFFLPRSPFCSTPPRRTGPYARCSQRRGCLAVVVAGAPSQYWIREATHSRGIYQTVSGTSENRGKILRRFQLRSNHRSTSTYKMIKNIFEYFFYYVHSWYRNTILVRYI